MLTRTGIERFRLANTEFAPSLNVEDSTSALFRTNKSAEAIVGFPQLRGVLRFRNILQLTGEDVGSAALTSLVGTPAKLVVVSNADGSTEALAEFARYRGIEDQLRIYRGIAMDDRARLARIVEDEFGSRGLEVVLDDVSDDLGTGVRSFEMLFPRIVATGSFVIVRWSWDHFFLEGFMAAIDADESEVDRQRAQAVHRILGDKGAILEAIVPDLVEAVKTRPDVVAAVTSTKHWLEVRRGPAPVDSSTFRLAP